MQTFSLASPVSNITKTGVPAPTTSQCTKTLINIPTIHLGHTLTVYQETHTATRFIDCYGCAMVTKVEGMGHGHGPVCIPYGYYMKASTYAYCIDSHCYHHSDRPDLSYYRHIVQPPPFFGGYRNILIATRDNGKKRTTAGITVELRGIA